MTRALISVPVTIVVAVSVVIGLFGVSLLKEAAVSFGPVENLSGIPYPAVNERLSITEPLAHADVLLNKPVLAQELHLDVAFIPHNTDSLTVGIRANSFWLSYTPVTVYANQSGTSEGDVQHTTVTIPLTDKLQEPDRSLDLMFFADTAPGSFTPPGPDSRTHWELVSLAARVQPAAPSYTALRDWLRSIIHRERAL